jgi:hypothetical protein
MQPRDGYLSSSGESSSDSDSEPPASAGTEHQTRTSADPHLRQTDRCRKYLEATGDISERVIEVLNLMESLHLNLPLFLGALSWNVPELVSNNKAALMMSDELPIILANWKYVGDLRAQGRLRERVSRLRIHCRPHRK